MQPVQTAGLVLNLGKAKAVALAQGLVVWLQKRGVAVVVPPEFVDRSPAGVTVAEPALMGARVDMIIVLGGDGTLLSAARRTASHRVPLLGVNVGHLGFLTEFENEDLFAELPAVLAGEYTLDERMMLACETTSAERYLALNDVVVAKGPFARLIRLRVSSGTHCIADFFGDGVILATPTGSTAYSLSAGGPVLAPQVQGIVVTPICPHSFYSRPIVVSSNQRLRLEVLADAEPDPAITDIALAVDAQVGRALAVGETLEVFAALETTPLVRRPDWSFYDVLRRKMAEGEVGVARFSVEEH